MTAKEIKNINREIARLKAKIARIAAEADNTSPKLFKELYKDLYAQFGACN